jgi:hypothetical protein
LLAEPDKPMGSALMDVLSDVPRPVVA